MTINHAARGALLGTIILGLIACSSVQVHQASTKKESWDGEDFYFVTNCYAEGDGTDLTKNPCKSYICEGEQETTGDDLEEIDVSNCGEPVATCFQSMIDPETGNCPDLEAEGLRIASIREFIERHNRAGRDGLAEFKRFLRGNSMNRMYALKVKDKVTDKALEDYANVGINLLDPKTGKYMAKKFSVEYSRDVEGIECEANGVNKADVFTHGPVADYDSKTGKKTGKINYELQLTDWVDRVKCRINQDYYEDYGKRIYQTVPAE